MVASICTDASHWHQDWGLSRLYPRFKYHDDLLQALCAVPLLLLSAQRHCQHHAKHYNIKIMYRSKLLAASWDLDGSGLGALQALCAVLLLLLRLACDACRACHHRSWGTTARAGEVWGLPGVQYGKILQKNCAQLQSWRAPQATRGFSAIRTLKTPADHCCSMPASTRPVGVVRARHLLSQPATLCNPSALQLCHLGPYTVSQHQGSWSIKCLMLAAKALCSRTVP